jgi:predicted RNA binding protein YcfA (HicA-like mRNA interferase family)
MRRLRGRRNAASGVFRSVLKLIEQDGWYLARQKGSQKQYKHPVKKGIVTIAAHKPSDDLATGTLQSILK